MAIFMMILVIFLFIAWLGTIALLARDIRLANPFFILLSIGSVTAVGFGVVSTLIVALGLMQKG